MIERYNERVHTEHAVLDIGEDVGALVIYTREELRGQQIDVSPKGNDWQKTHTDVLERRANGRPVFAALFLSLRAGDYTIWSNPISEVTIIGGQVAEVDWRDLHILIATNRRNRSTPLPSPSFPASQMQRCNEQKSIVDLLPPRYRNGKAVSAAPMGATALRYTEDGQVAWNEIWTDFCDLALAGGPPHRDSLLEPVAPDEVKASQEAYERVVAEIERGFGLITGLPTVRSEKLGWVGLKCEDEEMALWMLRAIVVENVCVRREGTVLFLPAGPDFLLEKEIKNVITVVAKTHHYWIEHCYA
ncbi:MAG: hypothetical protein NVSMB33_06140 [Ktedonobacteraceae bacterium]